MDTTLADPLLGHLLDERYRVETRIARGGMASVYLALDTRLDRTVAVKVMHPGLASDPDFVARFIREAKAAARLSHPNVVAVYDQGADRVAGTDAVFLIMEYVEGRTLRQLLREHGRLSPREALDALEPVLAALGAAHRAGIVHRDIKPENVLLADDGRSKVADFGLARAVASSTTGGAGGTAGLLMGTVAYLSPEQVERGIADPRSDVYSAGIVLYELLTGAKPHDGESPIHIAYRHVHDDIAAPSVAAPGLAPALDAFVTRLASRDPDERPGDASQALAELVSLRRSLTPAQLDHRATGPTDLTIVVPRTPAEPDPPAARSEPEHPWDATMVVGAVAPAQLPAKRDQKPVRKRRGSRRGWIAFVLILLLAAGLGGAGWYLGAGPGAYTSTPSLLNMTVEEATAAAQAQGLDLEVSEEGGFDETVPVGQVLSTDPEPGADIRKNGTISVVLSLGPERLEVPDVIGKTSAEAAEIIEDAGMVVGTPVEAYDEQVPAGAVISTSPERGTEVKRDTPVVLTVSKGREPIPVTDFTGKPAADARTALEAAGLVVNATEEASEAVAKGSVIRQDPSSGNLFRGGAVNLVVSSGPPLVDVPNTVGKSTDQARKILTDAGFQVKVEEVFGGIFGTVRFQEPGSGQAVKGSVVVIRVI